MPAASSLALNSSIAASVASALLSSTINEYLPGLQNGMYESEEATLAAIDEFNAKLEAAGINDVIAANQAQLDAHIAAKANK